VIKTESFDQWKYFARPLGLALLTLGSSLAHLLQRKYSFIIRTIKHNARNIS